MTDKKIIDENLSIFKKECHNYVYYGNRISTLKDRIMLLDLRMQNVYSPVLDKIGQTPTPHEMDYTILIEQKDKLKSVQDYYLNKRKWIEDTINEIPSPAYRLLVWLTYVERENLQELADEFNVSKQYIYKTRKRFLESVLTDERMQELKLIEDSYSVQDERIK